MGNVAIVSESSCNLPIHLVKQYGIHILPLRLCWQEEALRDGIDITARQVYERQEHEDYTPRTTTFSPGELLTIINSLANEAEAVVAILLPRTFTSSLEVARLVQGLQPALPLYIVDSKTAAMAQGFVVLEAARTAVAGGTVAQVLDRAEEMVHRVSLVAALETLKYLYRLGRVSIPVTVAATTLQIKPIVSISPGTGAVCNIAKPRTWNRAMNCLLDLVAADADGLPLHATVSHGNREDAAKFVANELQRRFDVRELYVNHLTPVMGAAAGPTVAIAYHTESGAHVED